MLTSTGVGSVDQDLVIAQEPCLRPLGSTLAANFVGHWRGTRVQEHPSLEERREKGLAMLMTLSQQSGSTGTPYWFSWSAWSAWSTSHTPILEHREIHAPIMICFSR